MVEDDVAGLVARDEPLPSVVLAELLGALGEHTAVHHVLVEGVPGLLFGHARGARLVGEVLLELVAQEVSCGDV